MQQHIKPGNVRKFAWFTLVELIVVITILVILGTIAFLNLGGFSSSARDGARVSDMTNISKGLELVLVKNGTVPVPEAGSITVSASGVVIGYQGYAGSNVLSFIKMSEAKDPLDKKYYTYSTNVAYTKYEMLGLMEDPGTLTSADVPFVSTAYAGYETRTPTTKGSSLGVLLGNTGASLNVPVQESYSVGSFTGVDVMTTQSGYTAYFSNKNSISGTGTKLMSLKASYTQRTDPMVYDSSLVGYWDMETLTPDGKLADLSGDGNSGSGTGGVVLGGSDGNGRSGKSTSFDGVDDYVLVSNVSNLPTTKITVSAWVKVNTNKNFHRFVNHEWSSQSPASWLLYSNASGQAIFGLWNTTQQYNATVPASTLIPGQWAHVVGVYDGSNIRVYVDGVAGTPIALSSQALDNVGNITISSSIAGDPLNGTIDEVRIYNRALSESEIQALYQAMK